MWVAEMEVRVDTTGLELILTFQIAVLLVATDSVVISGGFYFKLELRLD